MSDNLPSWPGADVCYEKAYCILEEMAKNGHVTQSDRMLTRRRVFRYCVPYRIVKMANGSTAKAKG